MKCLWPPSRDYYRWPASRDFTRLWTVQRCKKNWRCCCDARISYGVTEGSRLSLYEQCFNREYITSGNVLPPRTIICQYTLIFNKLCQLIHLLTSISIHFHSPSFVNTRPPYFEQCKAL